MHTAGKKIKIDKMSQHFAHILLKLPGDVLTYSIDSKAHLPS